MKKQLIAAAVALTLSVTAYADTLSTTGTSTGDHTINMEVTPLNELALILPVGFLDGSTGWNFDTDSALRNTTTNSFHKILGEFILDGNGLPINHNHCTLDITSENVLEDGQQWELTASNGANGIKYGIYSTSTSTSGVGAVAGAYGYASGELYNSGIQNIPFRTTINPARGCDAQTTLNLVTEPLATKPEIGTYTDTIRLTVSSS